MNLLLTGRRIRIASALLLPLVTIAIATPGHAEVGLRVESHPISAPIDAYVRVTEGSEPVTGLTPADFAVTLDNQAVEEFSLTLPPSQDSAQKVSVVIVMREDQFETATSYASLVDQLGVGDSVSVVKYWGDIERPRYGGLSILPFTELDGGPGSEQVAEFLQDRPPFSRLGRMYSLFDGVLAGLSQFEAASATLPDGPKAIVTVNCCGGRGISLSEVVAGANAGGIAIFNVGHAERSRERDLVAHLKALSEKTGGIHVKLPPGAPSEDALPTMSSWLVDGYRIEIPQDAIDDCDRHRLAVTVRGESASVAFSRCDTTPEPFRFNTKLDAAIAKRIRSNRVTITGIDTAVPIRVFGGEYSIGCETGFTTEPGTILPGETVCVRHVTASSGGLEVYTLLTVGGVSSWFSSSTVF